MYYQFGRYLLIAGSRAGGQPLNLQGMWNPYVVPPWAGAYTLNINLEMNYWPAEVSNLSECHEPLLKMIGELAVNGRKVAHDMYGLPGWVAHHNTTIWRDAQPIDGDAGPAFWNMAGPWLCQHLWTHYEFTGDAGLSPGRGLPDHEGGGGVYDGLAGGGRAKPAYDSDRKFARKPLRLYERGGPPGKCFAHPGSHDGHCADPGAVYQLHPRFGGAGWTRFCGTNSAPSLARLRPYAVGSKGQLEEWPIDFADAEPTHRHVSHLYGVFPGEQISTRTTPELAAAARRTLDLRGDQATGWSLAWKINLWARLGDGDRAHRCLALLLSPERSYPNLFDSCPPFQIDGNFGAASGIIEMLLHSEMDEIELLPALPGAWPQGSFAGLRAKGGYTVGCAWEDHRLVTATILSGPGGNVPSAIWRGIGGAHFSGRRGD